MKKLLLLLLLAAHAPGRASAQQPPTAPPAEPVISMRDFERVRIDLRIAEERELERAFPKFRKGEPFEIATAKGVVVKGTYQWTSTNYVLCLHGGSREVRVPLHELPFLERMRTDTNFRVEQLDLLSTLKARVILETAGIPIESFPPADAGATAYLAACGDPGAWHKTGKQILKGSPASPPDPGRAALYFKAAASLGNPDAQYALGRLYFSGLGLARDRGLALRWLSAAAEANHQEASEFLSKSGVGYEERRKAAEAQREALDQEASARKKLAHEYLKAWTLRLNKLVQPGSGGPVKIDLENPRSRYLVLRDENGEYIYRNGEKIHLDP